MRPILRTRAAEIAAEDKVRSSEAAGRRYLPVTGLASIETGAWAVFFASAVIAFLAAAMLWVQP